MLRKSIVVFAGLFVICYRLSAASTEAVTVWYDEKIYLSTIDAMPVSDVTIAGIKTRVVLDTAGSWAPFLTARFAKKAQLIKRTQHFPTPIFLAKEVQLDFGSLKVVSPMVGTASSRNRWFEKNRIAGIFNPLFLAEPLFNEKDEVKTIVLDFINQRFYGIKAKNPQQLDDYFDQRYTKQIKMVVPLVDAQYTKMVVQGGVGNKQPVPVLIDTGANASSFARAYLAGIPAIKQSSVMNFSGRIFYQRQTAAQPVVLNGMAVGEAKLDMSEADFRLTPADSDEVKTYQGIIGMDLLKHCALAISYPQKITFYCTPQ